MQTKGKIVVIASALLFTNQLFGQAITQPPKPVDIGGVPFQPYRKVGDRYYDLNPIYEWSKVLTTPINKLSARQRESKRPMPEWIGMPAWINSSSVSYEVFQVTDGGLLVRGVSYDTSYSRDYGSVFFLTNYPWVASVSEGKTIKFLALKTGVHKYRDTAGAPRTIDRYDYGTPYNPAALAAERAKTNSPSTAEKQSNSVTNAPTKPRLSPAHVTPADNR